jgi:hypothetical protein
VEKNEMSRIRIKVGTTEVEFEGSEDYMKQELPALIELLTESAPADTGVDTDEAEEAEVLEPSGDPTKRKLDLSTNTIASKLGAKTGTDLALATCAHLCLVKGADSFERKHILGEMRLATNFYKKSYAANLSSYLKTLVKDSKILETSDDKFALDSKEKTSLEQRLSGS